MRGGGGEETRGGKTKRASGGSWRWMQLRLSREARRRRRTSNVSVYARSQGGGRGRGGGIGCRAGCRERSRHATPRSQRLDGEGKNTRRNARCRKTAGRGAVPTKKRRRRKRRVPRRRDGGEEKERGVRRGELPATRSPSIPRWNRRYAPSALYPHDIL